MASRTTEIVNKKNMNYSRKFCKSCKENVKAECKGINHILHLILTVLTLGFWFIVWFILILSEMLGVTEPWTCSKCGEHKLDHPRKEAKRWCPDCQERVTATSYTIHPALHLILTIFTVFIWPIIWLVKPKRWKCPECNANCQELPKS